MSTTPSASSSGKPTSHISETPQQPARKCLIRQARLFPKKAVVWLQGIVVWMGQDQIAIDDGSGIARIDVLNHIKRDLASHVPTLTHGDYVLVVGDVVGRYRGHRLGLRATTVRNLSPAGVMMESMWHLEVIDAFLYAQDRQKMQTTDFQIIFQPDAK